MDTMSLVESTLSSPMKPNVRPTTLESASGSQEVHKDLRVQHSRIIMCILLIQNIDVLSRDAFIIVISPR